MPSLISLQQSLDPLVLAALTDDNGDGQADLAIVEAALADGEARVRAHLAARLVVPDGPLPPLLDDIALTLAIERLFERRRDVPPGVWTQRADRARRLLDDLASGALALAEAPRRGEAIEATRTADDRRQPAAVLNLY